MDESVRMKDKICRLCAKICAKFRAEVAVAVRCGLLQCRRDCLPVLVVHQILLSLCTSCKPLPSLAQSHKHGPCPPLGT